MNQDVKFKQTEIGKIPREWDISSIGDETTKIGSGITPRGGNSVYISEGVTLIRSQNIYNEGFNIGGLVYVDDSIAELMNNVEVNRNDVLLNITGDSVARCCIVPNNVLPARVNQHVIILRVKDHQTYYSFLRYYLITPTIQTMLISFADSGGTRKALTKQMVETFPIPIPKLNEQKAIAKILSDLDAKIELLQKQNETLEKIGQAIFKHWFVDFEFPNEEGKPYKASGGEMVESELGEIPKGWEVHEARMVADVAIGKTPPRKESQWFSDSSRDIKWVSIRDMGEPDVYVLDTSEYLTEGAVEKFNVLRIPDNTVLLSFKLTMGRVAITIGEMLSNEAIAHFLLSTNSPINTEYLYLYLSDFNYSVLGSTSSIATAVNSKIIKSMPILVPDTGVMKNFSNLVLPVFRKIKSCQLIKESLKVTRDYLLPKLMTGKIRVKV